MSWPASGSSRLARVGDLDREHVVAAGERAERARPRRPLGAVRGLAEVGDDDDEPGPAREAHRRGAARAPSASAGGGAPSGATPAATRAAQRDERAAPAARRQQPRDGRAAGEQRDAAGAAHGRAGRRTSATPAATSDFSRAAVPNAIEADTSSSTHVVSARSGTCWRTCGDAGARARRRVQAAHVVADLVGPDLRELGAGAQRRPRARSPGSAPAGAAREHEVERLDQRARASARALAGRAAARAARGSGFTPPPPRSAARRRAADRAEDPREHVVRRDAVAERVVGEHQPVAQHVGREVGDVLGDRVAAAAQQRERLRRLDQADRAARARAVLDQRREVVQAVAVGTARGVGERDRVADHVAVDEHARAAAAVALEVVDARGARAPAAAPPIARPTTAASSPTVG